MGNLWHSLSDVHLQWPDSEFGGARMAAAHDEPALLVPGVTLTLAWQPAAQLGNWRHGHPGPEYPMMMMMASS
jgi:hypothetical protein